MKFTHGIWFDREHTRIYNAVETSKVVDSVPGQVRALCTTRHVAHRGDTLNKPTITLNLSSPGAGMIAASARHFIGTQLNEPRFELFPGSGSTTQKSGAQHHHQGAVRTAAKDVTLESDGLRAVLCTEASALRIAYESSQNGDLLTDLGFASIQYIVAPPQTGVALPLEASTNIADPYYRAPASRSASPYMSLSFGLQVGEHIYGLGEQFGPLVKNGQDIEIWNEDAGTCSPYTYKNVPFYWSHRGYGIFFDHTDHLSVHVQTEKLAKVQVTIQGEEIRWIVIYGPTPKEILGRYASLTGHPPLPPAWSFGLYLSTSFLTDYDETTVMSQLDGMAKRGIPVSVFHFDCFWMKGHEWVNFTFDPKFFPDPKAFLSRLHQRGLKVCVWINSYIAQESSHFEHAAKKGYLIRRKNGTVWQSDIWQAGMGIVDFTNPDAVAWYTACLHELLDLGVDTFKTDFGERIPWEDVAFYNSMDPRAGHNYYSFLYNKTVYDAIASKRGPAEAVLFARAATAGGQQFPVHWGGDCESTWPGMLQSLRGGLSLGLSGFGFWSHDIGGFMSEGQARTTPNATLYKRWLQFGLLSSHSRLHGSATYRVPWLVDDEASVVLSKFAMLKNRLMPYLYAQAIQAHTLGLPMLRAMVVEFPDDRTCQMLDEQYMLGESLLVAPIFRDDCTVEYYVPAGRWTGLLDGKVRSGPGWFNEHHDYMSLPVLVREGSLILLGTEERPDYDWARSLTTVVVGALPPSAKNTILRAAVPSADQMGQFAGSVSVEMEEQGYVVKTSGELRSPELMVLNLDSHL